MQSVLYREGPLYIRTCWKECHCYSHPHPPPPCSEPPPFTDISCCSVSAGHPLHETARTDACVHLCELAMCVCVCVRACVCRVGTYVRTYICSSRSATSQLMKDKDQPSGSGLIAASKTSVGVESTGAMRYVRMCILCRTQAHTHRERDTHLLEWTYVHDTYVRT